MRGWLGGTQPRVAIVLGSGLGDLAASLEGRRALPYTEIPAFPEPGVAGHAGELVAGTLDGVPALLQNGRFHLYEGHEPALAALPVRLFADLGITTLVLTNAAGGLRPGFRPPLLMLIADHLNLTFRNPLLGPVVAGDERFPDMSDPYDRRLRVLARRAALEAGIPLEEGVYAGMLGPSYETPAEIRLLQRLGADAVGMSTVVETVVARARGVGVLGLCSITNLAAGLSAAPLSHDHVIEAGRRTAGDLERLLRGVVRALD